MLEVQNNAVWMVRAAVAAITVAACVQPAAAQTFGPFDAYWRDSQISYSYPGPDKAELRIPVKASVGGVCGFATAPNASRDVGKIDTSAWSEVVDFVPECTAPWRIAVTSQNGGLVTAIGNTLPDGYQSKAPYTVTLNVNNEGSPSPLTASCQAADIAASSAAGCNFKGTATTTVGLLVPRSYQLAASNITLSAPAYAGPGTLISGTYQDTLIVTVSPAS